MASLFRHYNAALLRRPMLTQCVTGAVLFGTGDVLAQQAIEEKGRNHDYQRTFRLTTYGGLLFAPIMTKWYQWLGDIKFKSASTALASRVGLDQVVMAPAAVAFFFSSMTFLEGKGIEEAQRRIESAYFPTLVRSWGVFIPTQVINFSIIPPQFRFGVVGVVSLFWNAYLSYANAKETTNKLSSS